MESTLLLSSVVVAYLLWWIQCLVANYRIARRIGFPIIISPVSALNLLWLIGTRAFPMVLQLKRLPFGLGTWARCRYMGWTFDDKCALHSEYGSIFTIVTPTKNEVVVADPDAANTILARRKDYIKPPEYYEPLNVFGPNLDTVNGDVWQRQRRLTAPHFNEKTSSLVWSESLQQAEDMSQKWLRQGDAGTRDVALDAAKLALHVLTSVGFGLSYSFHSEIRKIPSGHTMTYRDALLKALQNIIVLSIFPKKVLSYRCMPKRIQALGTAMAELEKYMQDMLDHERSSEKGDSNSLMGGLARASMQEGSAALGLSNEEVLGNIFIFSLAGHETTANAVAAAILLLAALPEHQKQIAAEIDDVLNEVEISDYAAVYPRLIYCQAVLYETLRLYGSAVFIPRSTAGQETHLSVGGTTHILPANTDVNLNSQALHTNPETWGSDSLMWRPDRWLEKTTASTSTVSFLDPRPGSFIPWSDGPRICVGKKFAQVEFMAVMIKLFSKYLVKPKLQTGQSEASARGAILETVEDSGLMSVTLQMRDPTTIPLVWERRIRDGYNSAHTDI